MWHYACAVQQNTTQAKEGAVGFHVALRMRISVQYYIHLHMKIKEQLVFIGLRMHIAQFSSLQQQTKKGVDGCRVALRMRSLAEYNNRQRKEEASVTS